MQLLVNKGDFEILAVTSNALETIKKCGCTCYQSEQRTTKDAKEFVEMLRKRRHWSMFDHIHISVHFKNVSRGFTHELVRHRLAAYSQESTRFVDPTTDPKTGEPGKVDLKVVMPPHRDLEEKLTIPLNYEECGSRKMLYVLDSVPIKDFPLIIESMYKVLREAGWSREDARQILPIGTKSDIVMTCDFTEWRHVFMLRTSPKAHWEIRIVMCKLLEEFKKLFTPVFDDFILAGYDDNGYPHYKIKGFVEDISKMIGDACVAWHEENEQPDSIPVMDFADYLEKYYEENY